MLVYNIFSCPHYSKTRQQILAKSWRDWKTRLQLKRQKSQRERQNITVNINITYTCTNDHIESKNTLNELNECVFLQTNTFWSISAGLCARFPKWTFWRSAPLVWPGSDPGPGSLSDHLLWAELLKHKGVGSEAAGRLRERLVRSRAACRRFAAASSEKLPTAAPCSKPFRSRRRVHLGLPHNLLSTSVTPRWERHATLHRIMKPYCTQGPRLESFLWKLNSTVHDLGGTDRDEQK